MTTDLQNLKRRLAVGRKSDGRSVYDEAVKSELVALCRQPGASVSRLARECGVNANQVGRWLREHGHHVRRRKANASVPVPAAFVAVAVPPAAASRKERSAPDMACVMDMRAHLPNGVAMNLRGLDVRHVGDVIEALGRLRCSASMKG